MGAGKKKLLKGCKPDQKNQTLTEVGGPEGSELLSGGELLRESRLFLRYEKERKQAALGMWDVNRLWGIKGMESSLE